MIIAANIIHILIILINIYIFVVILRVILSYFHSINSGVFWNFIVRITDPVLNLFRKIKFLRIGGFDLSPVAILLSLSILQYFLSGIYTALVESKGIDVAGIIILSILSIWNVLSFLLLFMIILLLIRLISLYLSPRSKFWQRLDLIIQPFSKIPSKILDREISYPHTLIFTIIALTAILFLGNFLTHSLIMLIHPPQQLY